MKMSGRNDPCPCGSGKKFKHCCLSNGAPATSNKLLTQNAFQAALKLHQSGQLAEAEAAYQRILLREPEQPDALHLSGLIAYQAGNLEIAAELINKAIRLTPNCAMYFSSLGSVLQAQNELDAAIRCFRKAISLKPGTGMAHEVYYNLANALSLSGELGEAVDSYQQAIALKPDYMDARSNLLFLYGYRFLLTPAEYLAQAREWERACLPEPVRQYARNKIFLRPRLEGRRLRIGYVSGDFRQHAISFFIEQLFACHDRSRVELFAYSACPKQDDVTTRLRALAEHWIPAFELTDSRMLDRIEADGIDVLIDLSGHTTLNRLGVFARRAAPVQAHYLGYFASTGLTEMDYWIGDEFLTPAETDCHFSEQVWRLPRTWLSYEGKTDAPVPAWQPDSDGTVWLGSFNNLGKLTPATLALWAKVLHAIPEAKLLLKTKELADPGTCQRILGSMAEHGIPANRLELQSRNATPGWREHMAYYDRLDIALDPIAGVGGGTTTCDALWMGVPIITLKGDRMASCMTTSMLNAIDYPEWIARSETEYIDKMISLARDVNLRKTLRPVQRERMANSPLCDAKDLATALENAYLEMFRRQQGRHWQLTSPTPSGTRPV